MCSAFFAKAQQEPQYTQNQFNNNLEINPSYAGVFDDASMGLRYRNQWLGFDGAPTSIGLTGESRIYKDRLGIGLSIINDKIGAINSTSADINVSSHIRVSQTGKIALGLKIGFDLIKSDFSLLTNIDPTDPLYQNTSASLFYQGLGALYYTDKMYIGISCPRILSFESSSIRTKISKPHYFLYGGYRIELDDGFELRPAVLSKYQAEAPFEVDFAMDVWFKQKLGFGASYRTNDAVTIMIKMNIQNLYIGYSYDMTVSGLRTLNTGTHEVYIGYTIGTKKSRSNIPDRNQNNRYF